ncbi:MAG: galactokinase, partial [Planctomycetota bacterium]
MTISVPDQAATDFREQFGSDEPYFCARAPGRVNLIGEHTDYNGGFVMPMAVDRSVWCVFRPTEGREVRLWSVNYDEATSFSLDDINKSNDYPWSNYVRGVAQVLQDDGHTLRPFDAAIYGNVPIGAGLSSSAAMEVSAALAFCRASDLDIPSKDLALLCQKAENDFVGVNCGIMDQFVSLHAQQDRAVLIDCRSLDHRLLPLDTDEVRVIVCDTNVHHELGDSAYNERRASCERAAAAFGEVMAGVDQLRDVSRDQFKRYSHVLDEVTIKRARHVVTVNGRVRWAVEKLQDEDY